MRKTLALVLAVTTDPAALGGAQVQLWLRTGAAPPGGRAGRAGRRLISR